MPSEGNPNFRPGSTEDPVSETFKTHGESAPETPPRSYEKRGRVTLESALAPENLTTEELRRAIAAGSARIAELEDEKRTLEARDEPISGSETPQEADNVTNETLEMPSSNRERVSEFTAAETARRVRNKQSRNLRTMFKDVAVVGLSILFAVGSTTKAIADINTDPLIGSAHSISSNELEALLKSSENMESISEIATYRGHFASEDGTTYNPEKGAKVNFGEALKSGVPEAEMKDDIIGRMVQPGQLATSYFYMQEKTTNPNFGVDGAKFNNPNDLLGAMIEDSDLHQKVYDYVKDIFRNNNLSEDTFSGMAHNFFLDSNFETKNIDTSHVEIVGCMTQEDETKVYSLMNMWEDEDGILHADIFTFKQNCGGQPLDKENFITSLRQIPASSENPGVPTSTPERPTSNPETPAPKDADRLAAIDAQIHEDIAGDINTGTVTVTPNAGVSRNDLTEKPSNYEGTTPNIIENEAASTAESVQPSGSNDYSQNRGGANAGNATANPVVANEEAQRQADAAETPVSNAPSEGQELADILGDLGIN